MGIKNYVVDGVSCAGKTSVCDELSRRGYHSIHGDRELAYWGDPETGDPVEAKDFENWLWDVERVKSVISDRSRPVTFLCGACRNFDQFIGLMDGRFVLEIDSEALSRRLAARPDHEWSGSPSDGVLNARREHETARLPDGAVSIDATVSVSAVVDTILERCGLAPMA